MALALGGIIGLIAVAVHEFSYASDHPHAYGPAKVIAWTGIAGAALGLAVLLIGYILARGDRS